MSAKRGEDKPTTRRAWGEEPPAEEASERTRKQKIKDFAHDKTPEKLKNPTDIQVRFRTGFVYVAVSVLCVVVSDWTTLASARAMAGISAGEFYYMLRSDAKLPNEMLGIIGAVLYPAGVFFFGLEGAVYVSLALLLALIVWYVFWTRARVARRGRELLRRGVQRRCCSRASSWCAARCRDPWGGVLVLGIFLSVWANDSFAYLVGRKFGKHKLAPRTSPEEELGGLPRRAGGVGAVLGAS